MGTNDLNLPLQGIRVLDLSRVLAGPSAAMALGDFGAEVIKVEEPTRGDDTRSWSVRVGKTESAYFNAVNRNKQSITVDLKHPEGQRLVRELAQHCDVLVHNFKTGGIERLGLGYERLGKANPRLIYCSISGYNASGPEAARSGYDQIIEGESGLMATNGEASGPPLRFGLSLVDVVTGAQSAQAILAALYQRERTGRGRHIQMALFECGVSMTVNAGLETMELGHDAPRAGNRSTLAFPFGVYAAKDGLIMLGVGNDGQFQRFCAGVIMRPDMAADKRFPTVALRSKHRDALNAEVERELAALPRATILQRASQSGVPCGEVLGLHEAMTSARVADFGLVARRPHPVAGSTYVFAPPYRFDGKRPPIRRDPPGLGADTQEVLESVLKLGADEIDRLKAERVI